jgi:hypothetical protein
MGMMIHRHEVKPVEKPVEKKQESPVKDDKPKKKSSKK